MPGIEIIYDIGSRWNSKRDAEVSEFVEFFGKRADEDR